MNIDDDFEENLEKEPEDNTDDSKNIIASRIRIWAIVDLICGIICAFWFSGYYIKDTYYGSTAKWEFLHDKTTFFIWIILGILSWLALSGFAEIIQILHDIRRNQKK